jgi:outer membrane protein assembly factor BamE (lipoprotein component of BamABCDE complex)
MKTPAAIFALTALAFALLAAGCASAPPQKPVADLSDQIKPGMNKGQVVAVAGEPKSRSADSDGGEVWQYRQTAKAYRGQQTAMNVITFGMATMDDAYMQDILTVAFTNGVVAKTSYQENVNTSTALQGH